MIMGVILIMFGLFLTLVGANYFKEIAVILVIGAGTLTIDSTMAPKIAFINCKLF